jgi:hypothetical protein
MLVKIKQTILTNKLLFTTGLSYEYNKRDKVDLFRNIQCQHRCKKQKKRKKSGELKRDEHEAKTKKTMVGTKNLQIIVEIFKQVEDESLISYIKTKHEVNVHNCMQIFLYCGEGKAWLTTFFIYVSSSQVVEEIKPYNDLQV